MSDRPSFFTELKRRNVIRVAGLYLVGAWLLIQIASTLLPTFDVPTWALRGLILTLALGFVPALTFSWVFELTPQGLKRDEDVRPEESIAPQTARRMNRMIIGVLVLALGYFAVDKFVLAPRREATFVATAKKPDDSATAGRPSAVINTKSIAVLPFENRSASGEDAAFLADGIHEDLINTLSRVPGLKVMSRTSVQRFRGSAKSLPDIAAELKVANLVEAGVQRAGDRVRVNVQLVRGAGESTLWSEHYDRVLTADGIFALQEEITAAIAQALKLELGSETRGALVTGTTKNTAAYEAFLKGRQTWKTNMMSAAGEAIARFKQAIELDPNFALAYGALAEAYITLGNSGQDSPANVYPLAKKAADHALAIDPRCIQALTALGEYAFHYEWDWDKAERLLRQALIVDPNYANAYGWLAGHLQMMNRAAEAKELEQRKVGLEPERPLTRQRNELDTLLEGKHFDEAVAVARRMADQSRGNFMGSVILGSTLRKAGQRQESVQVLEKAVAEFPDEDALYRELGVSYAELGQTDKARGVLGRLSAIRETHFVSPLAFVAVAAALNDRDLAFSEIERAFQLRDPFLPGIGIDENIAPIKNDPRFREVLKRLKLDVYFPEPERK